MIAKKEKGIELLILKLKREKSYQIQKLKENLAIMADADVKASPASNCLHDLVEDKSSIYSSYTSTNGSLVPSTTWPKLRESGADIKVKEIVLISMALMLLVTSLCLFYKNWKKNYRDINQIPYYSYIYKVDTPPATVTRAPVNTPIMHWAKAAAAIGTGLAFSEPKTVNGMNLTLLYVVFFNLIRFFIRKIAK